MQTRTVAIFLSWGILALAGCKSAPLDDVYRAHYTTTPPPGAVVLPAVPQQSVQPPLAIPPSSTLPN